MSSAPTSENWTTRKLLSWMGEAFTRKGLDNPRLFAEMLLAHVLGCERLRLYMEADRPASNDERERLRDLVKRALADEPVQYLIGTGWFFGLPMKVDRRVLIPRPSTETIVEHALQHARAGGRPKGEGLLIADVCTGSGCIAIALLKTLTQARAVATDVSLEALELAEENARQHKVEERVDFVRGDLLAALDDFPASAGKGALDYLVSNPPYVPDFEWDAIEPNVKNFEPHGALRGGADGLDFVRPVLTGGPERLKPGGLMLVEVADAHADEAAKIAEGAGLREVRVLRDWEGLKRAIVGVRL
ncbi:MAG: peptide chain release factor N(5)-glutamine methyltransferase [Planctomycetota bacterium]|nr:peptide chain release factor N(5)-glutamine methyltransferase [Planctomycetota bacterium]